MSATVDYEPHRLPAAILAVVVHSAFFALLYFGFTWQTQPSATMSVELWQSLPDEAAAPPVAQQAKPVVEETIQPQPPQPQEAPKPEIVMPDKKKKAEPPPVLPRIVEKKPVVIGGIGKIGIISPIGIPNRQAAQATREQSDKASAIGREVDEYKARINNKIQPLIVVPPNVADDARAIYSVTVLPGGTVLPPRLLQSSGNEAYDNAVERAILKAQPLPLPADAEGFNRFRELELKFSPKDKKR